MMNKKQTGFNSIDRVSIKIRRNMSKPILTKRGALKKSNFDNFVKKKNHGSTNDRGI